MRINEYKAEIRRINNSTTELTLENRNAIRQLKNRIQDEVIKDYAVNNKDELIKFIELAHQFGGMDNILIVIESVRNGKKLSSLYRNKCKQYERLKQKYEQN